MQTLQMFMQEVTHDLKTPLSVIMLSTQLLSRYVELDNPKIAKHIDNLTDHSNRLQDMINSILEMSQLNTITKIEPDRLTTLNLHRTIRQVTEGLDDLAQEKQINLQQKADEHAINVRANEAMIGQMLINLVENAITHTAEHGEITIKLSQTDSDAIIQIIDNGQGIPEDDLPYIFDRFYRVDKARNTSTGNSGLGLAIVKRIVDLHDGKINVKSELDTGTEFTITLPLVPSTHKSQIVHE